MLERVAFILVLLAMISVSASAQAPQLLVENRDGKSITITPQDLKQLPRQAITVTDPKSKAVQHYEGVLLSAVLVKAGAPTGKILHGSELRDFVIVKAADGYGVVFSLAELDQPTHQNQVLLADTIDGQPLDAKQGPFKLITPEDQRPERWVRMVSAISIRQAL